MEFYRCKHCGNMIAFTHNSGAPITCCGDTMERVTENTVEASAEKHIPQVVQNQTHIHVNVGSIDHPMEEKHFIEWIAIETQAGNQRKVLKPGDAPKADFYVSADDKLLKVYEYCNIHGLWSKTF